jgi:hypothetical protein
MAQGNNQGRKRPECPFLAEFSERCLRLARINVLIGYQCAGFHQYRTKARYSRFASDSVFTRNTFGHEVRVPGEVARESGMMSPIIPI